MPFGSYRPQICETGYPFSTFGCSNCRPVMRTLPALLVRRCRQQVLTVCRLKLADIFVVNKSDQPDADRFVNYLRLLMVPALSRR